jgi:hypothetical protein
MALEKREGCGSVHVRGRRVARASVRRQGTRREGYCEAMLSVPLTALSPRRVTDIHTRSAVALRSMTKCRLAGGDQPLNGSKLIGKAALNVLEPGGDHEITAVAEKGLYVGHEQVGFIKEIVCLRQL